MTILDDAVKTVRRRGRSKAVRWLSKHKFVLGVAVTARGTYRLFGGKKRPAGSTSTNTGRRVACRACRRWVPPSELDLHTALCDMAPRRKRVRAEKRYRRNVAAQRPQQATSGASQTRPKASPFLTMSEGDRAEQEWLQGVRNSERIPHDDGYSIWRNKRAAQADAAAGQSRHESRQESRQPPPTAQTRDSRPPIRVESEIVTERNDTSNSTKETKRMSNGSELKSRKPALPEGQQLIRVAQEIATWSEEAPEVRDLLAQLDTLRVSVPVLAEALTIFADDLLARRMHWKVTEKVGEASMSLIDAATSLMQAQQRLVRMYEGQLLQEESGITVTQETPDPRRRRRS